MRLRDITGQRIGIVVPRGGTPTITRDRLEGLHVGIGFHGAGTGAVVEGNRSCGNEQDLIVADGSSPALAPSNEVCDDATTE